AHWNLTWGEGQGTEVIGAQTMQPYCRDYQAKYGFDIPCDSPALLSTSKSDLENFCQSVDGILAMHAQKTPLVRQNIEEEGRRYHIRYLLRQVVYGELEIAPNLSATDQHIAEMFQAQINNCQQAENQFMCEWEWPQRAERIMGSNHMP